MLKKRTPTKGVTLIEVLIGTLLFAVIVLSTTVFFSTSSKSKKFIQTSQKKYDSAFTGLGEVGKYLSTSTTNITDPVLTTDPNAIVVYNYSTQECARFQFTMSDSYMLTVQKKVISGNENYKDCRSIIMNASPTLNPVVLVENISGNFISRPLTLNKTPITGNHSGLVIVYARVYDGTVGASGTRWIPIQTTVSLRDYLVEE